MPEFLTNAFDFLAKGGVVMIFIFLCSIVAIVFFIERCIALKAAMRQTVSVRDSLLEAVRDRQYERALTLCDSNKGAMAELAKCVIRNRHLTREGIQEVLADESKRQFAKLNRFIPAIGVIASISPLLGLLGTVTGMIQVFSNLADEYAAGAHANPGMLAGGIWEALLTTAAGLCVAIPAFLLHRILNAMLDRLWLELEKTATQLIDLIAPPPVSADKTRSNDTPRAVSDDNSATKAASDQGETE
ncbi:MAG: MotA/TolQ/ExbB proton channel family protein [Proteobacteria bacterium]|nr:MotA/TolQ/ExbB proton channel family protein [Pseudomonadota bacterium]